MSNIQVVVSHETKTRIEFLIKELNKFWINENITKELFKIYNKYYNTYPSDHKCNDCIIAVKFFFEERLKEWQSQIK